MTTKVYCDECDKVLHVNCAGGIGREVDVKMPNADYVLRIGDFEHDLTNRVFRGTMQAYMSGINWWIQENYEMFKHLNHNSVDYAYSYVLGYCENNPKNKFGEGILQYMVELPYIEN